MNPNLLPLLSLAVIALGFALFVAYCVTRPFRYRWRVERMELNNGKTFFLAQRQDPESGLWPTKKSYATEAEAREFIASEVSGEIKSTKALP